MLGLGWDARIFTHRVFFALALASAGCLTHYSPYDAGPGKRGYHIVCGNSFERCQAKAKDLCPGGYERVSSTRRSKLDSPELFVKTNDEYTLDIECDR